MIDIFDPAFMTDALITNFPPQMYLTRTYFADSITYATKHIDFDIKKGKRRMSPFVNRYHQGKLVERRPFSSKRFEPPYIKDKRVTKAGDYLERQPGEPVYVQGGAMTPAQRAVKILAEDATEQQMDLNRRIEWMSAKSLFTGEIPVVGDGVDMTIDLEYGAEQLLTLTGGDRWTEATATIVNNIRTWKRAIKQRTGKIVRRVTLGRNVAISIENNEALQKALDNRRTEAGRLEYKEMPDGAEYIGYLAAAGVELFTYDEWYYDEATDTEKEMVPENAVLLVAEGARMRRHYGVISDTKAKNFQAETFVKSWEEEDPSVRFLLLQSAPCTAIEEPEAVIVVVVQDAE